MKAVTTVSYQMTFDELMQASLRRKLLRPRFLVPLAAIFLAGLALLFIGDAIFYLGMFCIAYAIFVPLQHYHALRRLLKGGAWFTAPTTFSFDDSGVSMEAPGHSLRMAWTAFRSWSESEAHLFLSIDEAGDSAVTIPKRAFDADQMQSFQSHVMRSVAPVPR